MISLCQWIPYIALVCGVLVVDTPCGAAEQFTGNWVGGFDDGEDYVFLSIHLDSDNGKIAGTYDKPLLFQHGRRLKGIATDSANVRFEIPSEPEPEVFSGELKDGIIDGRMKEGPITRSFRLTRLASIAPEHYIGTYEIRQGHFVFIRPAIELGLGALQFIDFKTGRVAVFFPTSSTNFFVGPGVARSAPSRGDSDLRY